MHGARVSVSGARARPDRGRSALRLGLRAQDILIAVDPPDRISARNVIPAVVRRCEPVGDGVLVHVDAGEKLVAELTAGAARELGLATGRRSAS